MVFSIRMSQPLGQSLTPDRLEDGHSTDTIEVELFEPLHSRESGVQRRQQLWVGLPKILFVEDQHRKPLVSRPMDERFRAVSPAPQFTFATRPARYRKVNCTGG